MNGSERRRSHWEEKACVAASSPGINELANGEGRCWVAAQIVYRRR